MFLTTLEKLKPSITEEPISLSQNSKDELPLLRGIKPKKVHEIYELSNEISRNCTTVQKDCTVVVDLGSKFYYK